MAKRLGMAVAAVICTSLLAQGSPVAAQVPCTLTVAGAKLTGGCEHPWFAKIEIDFPSGSVISPTSLLQRLPLNGAIFLNGTTRIATGFVTTQRAGFQQVLLKPENPGVGWFTFDDLRVDGGAFYFLIDPDPDVPPLAEDIQIVRIAMDLLADESQWNQNDDRECEDDQTSGHWSLFCALRESALRTVGEYNHRNAAMQALRHEIAAQYPGRRWEHRLRDYNNLEETTFADIQELLDRMLVRLTEERGPG